MHRIVRFTKDISQCFYEKIAYGRHYNKYVLMFHIVSNDRTEWYDQNYSISMDSFVSLIDQLRKKGFQLVTPEDFLKDNNKKKVLLTFDDAFECVYYNVFRYLSNCKIPFIVFQTWNLLGKDGYLCESMIKEMLHFSGFTLGGHAREHVRVSDLARQKSLVSFIESKQKLEETFQVCVSYMAYPYGSSSAVSNKDRVNAKKAGYDCAFSTINSGVPENNYRKFFLPRINVNEENYLKVMERMQGK